MKMQIKRRLAAFLLVMQAGLMTGCVDSEKKLINDTGAAPPALSGVNFVNVCERGVGVCLLYWVNRSSRGGVSGGQMAYRDKHLAAFEALGDGRHWIAHRSSVDGDYHRYALMRQDGGTWTAYDFEPEKINADYLRGLADSGLIKLKESNGLFGRSVEVMLASRAGMLRWMRDMAELSSTDLSKIATPSVVSAASASDVQAYMNDVASSFSRAMLPGVSGDLDRRPLTASSGGCPRDLPSTIICTQYSRRPADPVAPIAPIEILYFYRDDCGHCERMVSAVAEWHLRLPHSIAFARHVANWKTSFSPSASLDAYDLNRVPALVINRKYKIELSASDPGTVKIALDLALRLAGELTR